ncbi:MAG TPA: hypothetical protein VK961_20410 [Chthoniobacter sp.]|nr:hypothetical protein [Chthoniobacter sp.]
MKKFAPAFIAVSALLGLAVNLHSQGILPKTPVQKLRELKAKNDEIIQKQSATLEKLDELDKQAEQMRFFVKRG